MNQKNSLGLNKCFLDLDDPFQLFERWFAEAKSKEINDPNALALGTANKEGIPSLLAVPRARALGSFISLLFASANHLSNS